MNPLLRLVCVGVSDDGDHNDLFRVASRTTVNGDATKGCRFRCLVKLFCRRPDRVIRSFVYARSDRGQAGVAMLLRYCHAGSPVGS